jgi:hypothetical protein
MEDLGGGKCTAVLLPGVILSSSVIALKVKRRVVTNSRVPVGVGMNLAAS